MIPLFKVFMAPTAHERVKDVLESGYVGEGKLVKDFERELQKFTENENTLCVNSGTSALVLALRVVDASDGCVLSTPMTCLATNTAIHEVGACIVWADVDPKTGLIDPESVEKMVKAYFPDAIMCMQWGGNPCNIPALNSFTVPLIEDACQALGSKHGAMAVGKGTFASCFSFQAIKTLTTGDGGAVSFLHKSDAKRARLMRWFGLDRELSSDMRCGQDPPMSGYKMQMNNISAAIGLENIKHLEKNLEKMQRVFNVYKTFLDGHKAIELVEPYKGISTNWLCTLLVNDAPDFIAHMRNKGVSCSKVHDRNDTKKIFAYAQRELPGVEEFDRRHVCIPCGWWLRDDDVEIITKALGEWKNGRHTKCSLRQQECGLGKNSAEVEAPQTRLQTSEMLGSSCS